MHNVHFLVILHVYVHLVFVTCTLVICLIHAPEAHRPQFKYNWKCYCNMGTCSLSDMFALSSQACGPHASGVHIRQATHAYVNVAIYVFYNKIHSSLLFLTLILITVNDWTKIQKGVQSRTFGLMEKIWNQMGSKTYCVDEVDKFGQLFWFHIFLPNWDDLITE